MRMCLKATSLAVALAVVVCGFIATVVLWPSESIPPGIGSIELSSSPMGGWFLAIKPDGSAVIQYGSSAGDDASLPAGTINFTKAAAEVLRQQTPGRPTYGATNAVAGLRMKGQITCQLSMLKDDHYFRNLLESVSGKWQSKGWRFDELRRDHPFFSTR
jgi:hypothetical protein